MKILLSVLLFGIWLFPVMMAQEPDYSSPAASEQSRFEAQLRQDTAALRFLLADELTYFHSNGLAETKNDFIQSVGSGKIRYTTLTRTGETQQRAYGNTTLITGIVIAKGTINGKEFDISLRYTSVYRKQRKGWKLVAWQSTKV